MRLSATPNTPQERPKFTCQHVFLGSQMTALLSKQVQLASTRLMLKNATSHTISCSVAQFDTCCKGLQLF